MKNINLMFFLIVSICLFLNSCTTTYTIKSIPKNERENHEFIGKVNIVYFTQYDTVEDTYARLLREAEQKYNGSIDVVNVKIKARFRGVIIGFMTGSYYKITAKGDVVIKAFDSIMSDELAFNLPLLKEDFYGTRKIYNLENVYE